MKLNLKIALGYLMVAVFFVTCLSLPVSVEAKDEPTVYVGGHLDSLAVSPDGKYVYVTNGEVVSVIDTSTNKLLTPIKAGDKPYGVAVSPDGKYVYVTNRDIYYTKLDYNLPYPTTSGGNNLSPVKNGSVSVISTATNTVKATVMDIEDPMALAVSPDGAYVYVLNNKDIGTLEGGGELLTINTATNSISSTLSLVDGLLLDLAVSPDGKYVYVTQTPNFVSVIDTSTNTRTTRTPIESSVRYVAVSPDGTSLYVTGIEKVYVVNTKSKTVATTISGLGAPNGVAVSPNGKYVYVTDGDNSVLVINTDTNRVEYSISVGVNPQGVVISPTGKHLYVANNDYVPKKGDAFGVDYVGTVSVISTDPNTVGTTNPSHDPDTENPNPGDNTDPNVSTHDSSFPFDTLQLLIIVFGAVVVVVGLLAVVRMKRGSAKTRSANSVKSKALTEECGLNSSQTIFFL
jgi:YVTN family beta-propeller protein